MNSYKKVHVIFKTHLDIGFTDLAKHVKDTYFNRFIPQAIQLAKQLKQQGGIEQFVWTTGSWLIDEYLKQASPAEKQVMDEAIHHGHITWHGLPFTTHTELMDLALMDYGLSLSKKLNAEYKKNSIAAKMTDVPGHTIAMVPHLAKFGIQYLHLGVNPSSKVPNVPDIFIWRNKDGSEVIVNYAKNYGNAVIVDGLDEVMVFAHTGDNLGPPSAADIEEEFKRLAKEYPGATIVASTMDAFAEKLIAMKAQFPIVHEEIGDTWIHGAASDPKKIAQYRELLRLRDQWLAEGRLITDSPEYMDFCSQLLLIPEHTWGMDEKKFLADYKNYSTQDFQAARRADSVSEHAIYDHIRYLRPFTMRRSYSHFESSWAEQREYVDQAVRCLTEDKRREAAEALSLLVPQQATLQEGQELSAHRLHKLGLFQVEFVDDGSISHLIDYQGKIWADENHRIGCFQYETFGQQNYNEWLRTYNVNMREHYHWADADWSKPGMDYAEPRPEHRRFSPHVIGIKHVAEELYDHVQVQLAMPEQSTLVNGAPKTVQIDYKFYKSEQKIDVNLSWFNKQANRLPEASWFSFGLKVDNPNLWKLDKLGQLLSPLEVVKNGNRNLHAVHSGVYYCGSDGKVQIETLDAPVVSPGEKRLLQFDNSFAPLDGGMHFNLHNNIWGTNFPMWFEEDMKFRFSIKID
ncbi:DUF5054 domain-containing protein [Paenibacillus sp. LHD-117]|uniref:DUF5054 domain-containing protein n=1 Tax=Paenibacillus sp. LHD-117 TaxID=3071412 RepID=UPI0027DF346E|nr:DUF5054 domain-containing protein [Paenibacillus sp. LHD-117]MDQ6421431.1 DUF5054 domain-containing protein [Paenibacillus sp. LHD-117]